MDAKTKKFSSKGRRNPLNADCAGPVIVKQPGVGLCLAQDSMD